MSSPPRPTPLGLLPEALGVALWRSGAGVRGWVRRTWLYRRLLVGPHSDRIVFHPYDALPRHLEDADALLRGRFRFEGETVEVRDRSVFDMAPPSAEWLEALHAFDWLPPLAAAGGDAAKTLATNLVTQWLRRYARYREPAWAPHILGRRLIALLCHGRFIFTNSDMLWRSKVFVSLREQSRMLQRIVSEAPEGLPRLEAATALALSGACLADPARLEVGLARLNAEIALQILPDGGHLTRSPERLLDAYRYVVMVMDALAATSQQVPQELRSAHDRMAPMIRFFRHGDGGLALFNGGGENDPRMVAGLLSRDEVRGQPFAYAPHSGYQRMTAGRTLVLMECGAPPQGAYSANAHAGCLSFELSAATQRIVVNCGTASLAGHRKWQKALRATAAHSTVTVADTSSALLIGDGWIQRTLGPRLISGPTKIETRRVETEKGGTVEGAHNGYEHSFGIRHERTLTLSPQGLALTGLDRLIPHKDRKTGLHFAIRFHIHPDVRVSTAQSGDIILKLPNGEGWRFRADAPMTIEESVYLGGESIRRSEQLVLTGIVKNTTVEISWMFDQIGVA